MFVMPCASLAFSPPFPSAFLHFIITEDAGNTTPCRASIYITAQGSIVGARDNDT